MRRLWPLLLFTASLHAQIIFTANEASTYPTSATMIDAYDGNPYNSQYLKNLVAYSNPSFLSYQVRVTEQVASGTTTGFTSAYYYDPNRIANDFAGFTFLVRCHGGTGTSCSGGAQGCTGTITSNTAPSGTTGPIYALSTTCAAAINNTDSVQIVSPPGKTGPLSELGWQFGGSGTFSIGTTNLPPAPASPLLGVPQYLKVTIPAGGNATLTTFTDNFNGTACNSYNIIGNYNMTLTAAVQSGTGITANMSFVRFNGGTRPVNGTANLTGTWNTYTVASSVAGAESPANACGSNLGIIQHQWTINNTGGTTAVVGITNVATNELSDTNPSPFRDAFINKAKFEHVKGLRFNAAYYDAGSSLINDLTPIAYRAPATAQLDNVGAPGVPTFASWGDKLKACQQVGNTCSLNVSPAWTNADLSNAVDYLAGSTGTTYGALRASLDQSATWTSLLHVNLEVDNETWNSRFPGIFTNPVQNYYVIAGQVCATLAANTNWSSALSCVASVQQVQGSANSTALAAASVPSGVKQGSSNYSLAGYLTNCTSYAQDLINETWINTHNASTDIYSSLNSASTYPVFHYEAAPAPYGNTTPCSQAQLMGGVDGLASGLAAIQAPGLEYSTFSGRLADYGQWEINQLNQVVYPGTGSRTVNMWGDWGYIDGPFQSGRPRAIAMSGANPMYAMGTGYAVTSSGVPTINAPAENNLPAQNGIPTLIAAKFGSGTNRGWIVQNNDPTNTRIFFLAGTNAPSGTVSVSKFYSTTGSFTDTNETVNNTGPVQLVSLGTVSNPTSFTIPPASALFISYSTTTTPPSSTIYVPNGSTIMIPAGATITIKNQ